MFLLYVYMFTICSCHVVLKVYLLNYLSMMPVLLTRLDVHSDLACVMAYDRLLMIGGCTCIFIVGSLDIAKKLRQAVNARSVHCCLDPVSRASCSVGQMGF